MATYGPQNLPYPQPTDAPDGPGAFLALDQAIAVGGIQPFATLTALTGYTGLFVGQRATVTADATVDNNGDYIWSGTAWVGGVAPITSIATGFTANAFPNSPRILRQGNRRTMYGEVVFTSGGTYSNILTVPVADQPPTATTRTIGIGGMSTSSAGSLVLFRATLTAGVLGAAIASGSEPAGDTVYLSGLTWLMD